MNDTAPSSPCRPRRRRRGDAAFDAEAWPPTVAPANPAPGSAREPRGPRSPSPGRPRNQSASGCVMKGDGGRTAGRMARGGVCALVPHRLPDPGQPGRRRGGGAGGVPAGVALPRLALRQSPSIQPWAVPVVVNCVLLEAAQPIPHRDRPASGAAGAPARHGTGPEAGADHGEVADTVAGGARPLHLAARAGGAATTPTSASGHRRAPSGGAKAP